MVLPVRNSSVKNTAPRIALTMKLMSPNCLMNDCVNSFSLCDLVSSGELTNSLSIAAAICADWFGSLTETRSEEHTSELQSLMRISYAVFCLKKKTYKTPHLRRTLVKC